MSRKVIVLIVGMMVFGVAACGTADPAPIEVVEQPEEVVEMPEEQVEQTEPEVVQNTPTLEPEEESFAPEGTLIFQLVDGETEARFIIDELLRGEPKTVVGATSAVTGEIYINIDQPANTEVGVISIEAGTLRTDNNFRNRAIRDFILQTGNFPVITFSPISLEGLPEDVAVGTSFTFEIIGDLTIRDITQEVRFSVDLTAESDSSVRGTASTTILRQDFDLQIPSVPQVAGVDPQVILELDFLAKP